MKTHPSFRLWVLALVSAWLYAHPSFAGVQVAENFDTNWPTFAAPGVSTNMLVNNWLITSGSIIKATAAADWYSSSNVATLYIGGNSSIRSPYLTNGAGSLTFFLKSQSGAAQIFAIELSADATIWTTNSFITNSSTTFTAFTNTLSSFSDHYIRIRRTDSVGSYPRIDNIQILNSKASVTLGSPTGSPALVHDLTPVDVSIPVTVQSAPDSPLQVTNWWREWPSNTWQANAMASNQATSYATLSQIPGKSTGTRVEYYVSSFFQQDNQSYTNFSSTNSYTVLPKSSYTSLVVTGLQLNASLSNGVNYQWQGVIQVTNNNPPFQFRGTSNTFTTTWGDANQSVTNIPLYGFAAPTTSNTITLNTTNNGSYLFAFNETNLEYSVRSCTYENFNTWTNLNASTNTPSTNSTGWALVSGNTSNDTSRIFSGTGRSAIIETNGWLQTPYLSNGVGQVSFWYRNWSTTGAPTGKFQIQVSSDATTWNNLVNAAVSNIVSTNYIFCSVAANDGANKYVRILNTNTTTRLCLDEVVIAQPGAYIIATNLGTTPANPTYMDTITLSVDLAPYNGASITNAVMWYRIGDAGIWVSGTMTNTGGTHYILPTPLTGLPVGNLYCTVQPFFSGFQANPTFFPTGGTNSPTTNSITAPGDNLFETFDTNWPTFAAPGVSTNMLVNNWLVTSGSVIKATAATDWYSSSNVATLYIGGNSSIRSPYLTNGAGSLTFFLKSQSGAAQIFAIELSADATAWTTNSFITNSSTTFTSFTNTLSSFSDRYIRIRRTDAAGSYPRIDDIRITYPPANVSITNIFLNPGYPVAGQAFTASCDVVSMNPFFPAYNIVPTFYGTTFTNVMKPSWVSGVTNHYSLAVSLSTVTRDTLYRYIIKADFDGYCGSPSESLSPKTSTTNEALIRSFSSTYSNISATANASTLGGRLLTNGLWRDIITAPDSNSIVSFSLKGYGYSSGNGWATSTNSWGNSSNWQTSLPLADTAYLGETNISFTASSNSQYVVQFNEQTGEYIVQQCVWQDWENWAGTTQYVKKASSELVKPVACNFDAWSNNTTRTRTENFSDKDWTNATSFSSSTNLVAWGTNFFQIYGAKINSQTVQIQSNTISPPVLSKRGWISQLSYDSGQNFPLRGLSQITYSYKVASTNQPVTLGVYLFPTNQYTDATSYYFGNAYWSALTNYSGVTNTTYITNTLAFKTNTTFDVIFSHDDGAQISTWNYLSVSEWYADTKTNDGWIAYESWIETQTGTNNRCRFDPTRADGTNQYIRSPLVPNGINSISFSYCGADTNTIKFDVETSKDLITWSLLQSVTASTNNYATYTKTVTNLSTYVRINSKTVAPGILLIDDISLTPVSKGSDWVVNNTFINADDPANPPLIRQYYGAAAYLNSNRTTEVDASTDATTFPYIQPPPLPGIGDISFWYRNWATNGTPAPTRVVIQTSVDFVNWTTVPELTADIITNTADYRYYSRSIYDTNSQYVRILNIDTNTPVGRVCFDNILVTTPLASSLSISNMTLTPSIPLATPVKVSADVYGLFYNPSNIILTLQYATGSTYSAAMGAPTTGLLMKPSSNNPAAPGKWFQYTNSIPAFPADTYVKYQVLASFTGTHSEVTSPRINNQFVTAPTWYAPLQDYTNNLTYYIVLACPTNAVWFNEFNVIDDPFDSREKYIEVCGPSSLNLSNWVVQMFSFSYSPSASYRITNGALANSTNSFGFWVIGDTNTVGRNMTLTNSLDQPSGGFRLVRPVGIYADAIAYGTESAVADLLAKGFRFTAEDDPWSIFSVALTGTGSNASTLTWINWGDITPGRINTDQYLLGESQVNIPPPIVSIDRFWVNTNVWIICTTTNTWYPAPWYTTNLISSNSWAIVPTFSSSMTSSNALLWFSKPINSGGYFYKVVVTNN